MLLTHDPPPAGEMTDDVQIATDLETAIRLAEDAAGGKYVNVLGADVARGASVLWFRVSQVSR